MRKLTLSILAASIALVPAAALAEQQRGGGGHGGGQWRGGGGHGGGQWRGGGGGHRGGNRGGGFFGGGFFGGGFFGGGGGGGGQTVVVFGNGGHVQHPGADYRHRRLRRGAYIHPYWYGDQFHVGDWRGYGFRDPGRDRRWIRYYDDAYLVDRGGRVVERHEDYDWDRHGEEWDEEYGVPGYRGRGHRRERGEEHEWAERDGDEHHAEGREHREYRHGGTVVHGGPAYDHGGYAYGYGYGYGYAYPIVIETTTTYGQSYTEEVVEEYVTVQRPRRRVRSCNCARPRAVAPRPRPAPRPAPRPRPPAGERG